VDSEEFDLMIFETLINDPPDAYSLVKVYDMSKLAAKEVRRLRAELCRRGAHIGMVQPEVPWQHPQEIKGV
jgi:hypothetical protein